MDLNRAARLAELLRRRNKIDSEIANLIGRPALMGHLGEFIAAEIFDIDLHPSATHKGSDGRFRSGPLVGQTVNVKFYGRQEGLLDMVEHDPPETYLVLTGEVGAATSSRGVHRPVQIRRVYLFPARAPGGGGCAASHRGDRAEGSMDGSGDLAYG